MIQGVESEVEVGAATVTMMGERSFSDKDGRYHHHAPNKTSTLYTCSNNHTWVAGLKRPCPARGCTWR